MTEDQKPGDRIRVTTADEVIEGTFIPRPEIIPGDILVLKLENGYNVGIEKKKIKDVQVLKKEKESKLKTKPVKKDSKLPTVKIISTGGTISSMVDYTSGGVRARYTAEDFVRMMPELTGVANIESVPLMQVMSEDIEPEHWKKMARTVAKELNGSANGLVITHGTDTMHYSAAALSFMLSNINKPVVLTGSQRSIDRGSSDAFMNIQCAVQAAANSDIAEVTTCMHATSSDDYCYLIRGTRVRKMHTSRRDAFRPINDTPLAKAFPKRIEVLSEDYNRRSKDKAVAKASFTDETSFVHVYPGMDPGIINYHVRKGVRGIVIAATALGHVPSSGEKSIIPSLKRAQKAGVLIVIATQTIYGRVHPYVYTNLRKLSIMLDCVFVEDMLAETAYVKLGWVLSRTKNQKKAAQLMRTNLAGEMTSRSDFESYLA